MWGTIWSTIASSCLGSAGQGLEVALTAFRPAFQRCVISNSVRLQRQFPPELFARLVVASVWRSFPKPPTRRRLNARQADSFFVSRPVSAFGLALESCTIIYHHEYQSVNHYNCWPCSDLSTHPDRHDLHISFGLRCLRRGARRLRPFCDGENRAG